MNFIDEKDLKEVSFDAELENYARDKYIPIIRPIVVDLLSKIVSNSDIKSILEIGTAIGYSGSLMLKNNKNAFLDTIEIDLDRFNFSTTTFNKFGLSNRVSQYLGDAGDIILNLEKKYDLIFLDGPKAQYLGYAPTLIDLLNDNGYLVADNVGQHGTVFGDVVDKKHHALTNKVESFLDYITHRKQLSTQILLIGDGVSISKKFK